MNNDKKRQIRNSLRRIGAYICSPLYLPHLIIILILRSKRQMVFADIQAIMKKQGGVSYGDLLYTLHTNKYYRAIFYHRLGPAISLLISWIRPADETFWVSYTTKIGAGCVPTHAFATVLNARSIGENFSFRNGTTLGAKWSKEDRPTIGNNVTLGATVTIIGDVTIGDNVIIGAGSVVTKDIPSNSIVAGNPAKVLKTLT